MARSFPESCWLHPITRDIAYLQQCVERSPDCYVACEDVSQFQCLNDEPCAYVQCSQKLKDIPESVFGFRPVFDLVVTLTDKELAFEIVYKELLRGPDFLERENNDNTNRWNPCVTAEVSVDVANNGVTFSSVLNDAYALSVEPTEKYIDQTTHPERYQVPGSWGVLTYGSPERETLLSRRRRSRRHEVSFCRTRGRRIEFIPRRYIREDRWVDDWTSIKMDRARCARPLVREEGNHTREEGWYVLRGLESALLAFDLAHVPNGMVYGEHYRLAIYARPSRCDEEECDAGRSFLGPQEKYPCRQPLHLPKWFDDPNTPKNIAFNMTLTALDDVIFKVEFHILHGVWLGAKEFLRNSATVQVLTPKRARHVNKYTQNQLREQKRFMGTDPISGKEIYKLSLADKLRRQMSPYVSFEERDTDLFYIIGAIYNNNPLKHDAMPPLNLPPRFKQYERGRVLVSFNTTYESKSAVPTVAEPEPDLLVDATWFEPMAEYDMCRGGVRTRFSRRENQPVRADSRGVGRRAPPSFTRAKSEHERTSTRTQVRAGRQHRGQPGDALRRFAVLGRRPRHLLRDVLVPVHESRHRGRRRHRSIDGLRGVSER